MTNNTFPENLSLPLIESLDAIAKARQVLDIAVITRTGFLLLGPQGMGKSAGFKAAVEWFEEGERLRQKTSGRRRLRALLLETRRGMSYWETAVAIARKLDPRYKAKIGNRKKDNMDVVDEAAKIALAQGYAAIIIDDAENCSDESILCFRDMLNAGRRAEFGEGEHDQGAAGGIAVVLSGRPELLARKVITGELRERWSQVIDVDRITPKMAAGIYKKWMPGLHEHIEAEGDRSWITYISSLVQPVAKLLSIRMVKNHVQTYVVEYCRRDPSAACIDDVRFDRGLWEDTWERIMRKDCL